MFQLYSIYPKTQVFRSNKQKVQVTGVPNALSLILRDKTKLLSMNETVDTAPERAIVPRGSY